LSFLDPELVSRIGDYLIGTGLLVGMFATILWDVVLHRDIGAGTELDDLRRPEVTTGDLAELSSGDAEVTQDLAELSSDDLLTSGDMASTPGWPQRHDGAGGSEGPAQRREPPGEQLGELRSGTSGGYCVTAGVVDHDRQLVHQHGGTEARHWLAGERVDDGSHLGCAGDSVAERQLVPPLDHAPKLDRDLLRHRGSRERHVSP